jgi:hypothetical protein
MSGNTILSGDGSPSRQDNLDSLSGDFYIDTGAWCIYGPLTTDGWGPGQPLIANGTCEKIVFVTSGTYTGDLGGLTGADEKCAAEATAAGLDGEFKAWLSDFWNGPQTRFSTTGGPYVLPDGTLVANDWDDLTDGTIANPINKDGTGEEPHQQSQEAFTNTLSSGSPNASSIISNVCGEWTTVFGGAPSGRIGATDSSWTDIGNVGCDYAGVLYCFQQ